MIASRRGPASPRHHHEQGRTIALAVVAVLVVAALLPEVRIVVLAALVAALLVAPRFPVLLWPVAAAIPAAVNLAWGTLPPPSASGPGWCADPLSPPALWRAGEAVAVFVVVALLMLRLGSSPAAIGLVRPSRALLAWSLVAALLVAVGSLALGTLLAGPFFGTIRLKLDDPRAIIPAVVLAVAPWRRSHTGARCSAGSPPAWVPAARCSRRRSSSASPTEAATSSPPRSR